MMVRLGVADATQINGKTRVVYVIADPIEQIQTPQSQNRIWRERGVDVVTVPAHVKSADLERFVDSLRVNHSVAGAVVTIPHKQAVIGYCDDLGPNARASGAVNVLRRADDGQLVGETFDGMGFVQGLRDEGIEPNGLKVGVMGAGGAASAVSFALVSAGVRSIELVNRTESRAAALAVRVRESVGDAEITVVPAFTEDLDLVVNATSLGMTAGSTSPIDFVGMSKLAIAADVVVSSEPTAFLAAAERQGLKTHGGVHMLNGQMKLIADYLAE